MNAAVEDLMLRIKSLGIVQAIDTMSPAHLDEVHVYHTGESATLYSESEARANVFYAIAPSYPLRPACDCSMKNLPGLMEYNAEEPLLRWSKVMEGATVTVSWDQRYTRVLEPAAKHSMKFWNTELEFLVPAKEGERGDIHISIGYIDGKGKTLGITYMPTSGTKMDVAWWAGDMILDSDALQWSKAMINTVMAHEFGHAIGMPHSENRKSIMYPSYLGARLKPSAVDMEEFKMHYDTSNEEDATHCGS